MISIRSGFPPPQEGGTSNMVHPKSEGSHAKTAIVGLAHALDVEESQGHVPLKLTVYLVFIPHEPLNVLQTYTQS